MAFAPRSTKTDSSCPKTTYNNEAFITIPVASLKTKCSTHRSEQRGSLLGVYGVDIRSVFEEQLHAPVVPVGGGQHQRRLAESVFGVDHRGVFGVLEQEAESVGVAVGGGAVDGGLLMNDVVNWKERDRSGRGE